MLNLSHAKVSTIFCSKVLSNTGPVDSTVYS